MFVLCFASAAESPLGWVSVVVRNQLAIKHQAATLLLVESKTEWVKASLPEHHKERGNRNRVSDTQSTAYHSCSEPRLTTVRSCCPSASLAFIYTLGMMPVWYSIPYGVVLSDSPGCRNEPYPSQTVSFQMQASSAAQNFPQYSRPCVGPTDVM